MLTSQTVYSQCFNSNGTSNPSYDPNNFFCSLIVRSPTDGSQQTVKALFENLGGIKTSGIDVQLNWAAEFEDFALPIPGTVSIDFYFNHLNNYKTQTQKGQKFIDFADTSGDGTFTEGIAVPLFRDQETTTFGYALGPANVNLRWRHLPGVRSTTPGNLPAASYEEFDFFGTYRLTDTYTIRAGVENVFDKQPPITAAALANLATGTNATTGQGFTYNGSYDVLGRRFYIGLHAKY